MPKIRTRIIVLGSGFAAYSFLRRLCPTDYDLTVVSLRNHLLYTPLLTHVATGAVRGASIVEPLRSIDPAIKYHCARCIAVREEEKTILCRDVTGGTTFDLPYDSLIFAVGGANNTCSIPGVEEHARFIRTVEDAESIRHTLLTAFDSASAGERDDEEIRDLLRFVVVGSSPKAYQLVRALRSYISEDIQRVFPALVPLAQVVRLRAMDEILPAPDRAIVNRHNKTNESDTLDGAADSPVREVTAGSVGIETGEVNPSALTVWCTPMGPTAFVEHLSYPKDPQQRLVTDECFRIGGREDLYAIGDCASIEGKDFPRTAHIASLEGSHLAENFSRAARSAPPLPFACSGRDLSQWGHGLSPFRTPLLSLRHKAELFADLTITRFFGRSTTIL